MIDARRALQFAVVREDPRIELEVLARFPCQRLLLVTSGGCTALALRAAYPRVGITLVDPNAEQFSHLDRKRRALGELRGDALKQAFNIGCSDSNGLSESGNFEALFRGLRRFLHDFVAPYDTWSRVFSDPDQAPEIVSKALCNPYWPVAFQLYFSDTLLNTMFGVDATQHATPGSYPSYFQALIERGLQRDDAHNNPFLHHIFLGHYVDRNDCLPVFLQNLPSSPGEVEFNYVHGLLEEVADLGEHDFVDLSNILDWSKPEDVAGLCAHLAEVLRPGAVVLWRQLNNWRDIEANFNGSFTFDAAFGQALQARDQSLFYSSIHIGVRQ
ncbi:MAG: DUF3419 family protein [Pseudomarimonas sp.]